MGFVVVGVATAGVVAIELFGVDVTNDARRGFCRGGRTGVFGGLARNAGGGGGGTLGRLRGLALESVVVTDEDDDDDDDEADDSTKSSRLSVRDCFGRNAVVSWKLIFDCGSGTRRSLNERWSFFLSAIREKLWTSLIFFFFHFGNVEAFIYLSFVFCIYTYSIV